MQLGVGEGHQGRSSIKAGQAEALATRAGRAVARTRVCLLSVCLPGTYCRLYSYIIPYSYEYKVK